MAKVGRFARGGTGGSNLSQLVYDIMRSQYTRQVNAVIEAYMGQYDYRGMGVPSLDYVLSFLNDFSKNEWLTQADRDNIAQNIVKLKREENSRIESGLLNAIAADKTNAGAIKNYIEFLRKQESEAETADLRQEATAKIFTQLGNLTGVYAKSFVDGLISLDQFDANAKEILGEYDTGSSQHKELLTTVMNARYEGTNKDQLTILGNSKNKGNKAYLDALKTYKAWQKVQIAALADQGLAKLDTKGNVIEGIAAANSAQDAYNSVESDIKDLAKSIATTLAGQRLESMDQSFSGFLSLVNQTLGSNFTDPVAFANNQVAVNRFYSLVPSGFRSEPGFMGRGEFIQKMFGETNSLLSAAKTASKLMSGDADTRYSAIAGASKNWGKNSIVDDFAILANKLELGIVDNRGNSVDNAALLNSTIVKYQELINKYGNIIPKTEMIIHQNTLSAMQQAAQGKEVTVEGVSAYDLANPNASQYDQATQSYVTVFDSLLGGLSKDATTAKEIATGSKVLSAAIGADGKLQYFGGVDARGAEDKQVGVLNYIAEDNKSYKPVALLGTSIMISGATDAIGTLYVTGPNSFIIEDSDGVIYKKNYDPFANQTTDLNGFRAKYIRRVGAVTAQGAVEEPSAIGQFVLPSDSKINRDPKMVSSADDAMLSGFDERIKKIGLDASRADFNLGEKGISSQIYNAQLDAEYKKLIYQTANSPYAATVQTKYSAYIPQIPTVGSLPPSQRDNYKYDNLTAYAFRNTPISSLFTPQEQQKSLYEFRAGEKEIGVKPITPGGGGGGGTGPGRIGQGLLKL